MDFLKILAGNYVVNCAIAGWISAQVIKVILTFISSGKLNAKKLYRSGGMPSSHSSMVCALTLAVAIKEGPSSTLFAVTLIFSCIIMYDAMHVRRSNGDNAKTINKMIDSLDLECAENEQPLEGVREVLGHTPLEVFAGVLLGLLIPLIIPH